MEACNCSKCISACLHDPGRLIPGDVLRLSRHLKLSEQALKQEYLVHVPVTSNGHTTYALAPAKKKGQRFIAAPGTTAANYYADEKGRCIFLDNNNRCSIHAVKPFECGAYMGCRNTFLGKPYRDRIVEDYFYKRWKLR